MKIRLRDFSSKLKVGCVTASRTISAELAGRHGQRLDIFLVRRGWAPSRRKARELIDGGRVMVNGRRCAKGEIVAAGDDVCISELPPAYALEPNPHLEIETLYEDEAVVVVNKPGLIPCHPLREGENNAVINAVAASYPEAAKAGDKLLEGGLVHRLDNGTSGALIIARNLDALAILRTAIRRGDISRRYLALCVGHLKDEIEIAIPIAHHAKNRRKMIAVPANLAAVYAARPAATVVRPLQHYASFSLIEAKPRTGCRHQIRAHLASIGHPLAGDTLYGGPEITELAPGRFWLHLSEVAFESPASGYVTIQAPLPLDLDAVLRQEAVS
jgi:23S rRNA pseudouridine1911/1915/1917 synthase